MVTATSTLRPSAVKVTVADPLSTFGAMRNPSRPSAVTLTSSPCSTVRSVVSIGASWPSASSPVMRSSAVCPGSGRATTVRLGRSRSRSPSTRRSVASVWPRVWNRTVLSPGRVPRTIAVLPSTASTSMPRLPENFPSTGTPARFASSPVAVTVRPRRGNTASASGRSEAGAMRTSASSPAGAVEKNARLLATTRSDPSEGRFTMAASVVPAARAASVVEPPPSRLTALCTSRSSIRSPSSCSVIPRLSPARPSIVTIVTSVPSRFTPIAVRAASTWSASVCAPSTMRRWAPLTARSTSAFTPTSTSTGCPAARAASVAAPASRPMSTPVPSAIDAGAERAAGSVVTDCTTPSATTTMATDAASEPGPPSGRLSGCSPHAGVYQPMPPVGSAGVLMPRMAVSTPSIVSVPSAMSSCTAARPSAMVNAGRGAVLAVRTPSPADTFVPTGATEAFMSK